MAVPTPGGRATLDFFGAQARARRGTAVLVVSFALAVCVVVAIVYAALLAVAGATLPGAVVPGVVAGTRGAATVDLVQPGLFLAAAAGVLAVTGLGATFHAVRLSAGGGEAVAEMLGGVRIDRGTQEPAERRLVNVAEEMAIASGLPVPRLYVLPGEQGINAFAAGYTPGHSVVAVTRGALDRLTRDEIQGVLAHELSHVLNADTRLDLRLMAAVGGLAILALVGRVILRNVSFRSRDSRGSGAVALVGLGFLAAGAFGALCGKLVRFAVARQREWLADASAVQFTRNPDGLASALRKIAADGSAIHDPHAPEAAHIFFASAATGFFSGLFSTHPPIEERIRRLAASAGVPAPLAPPPRPAAAPASPGLASRPAPEHLAVAAGALGRIPSALAAAAREPLGARSIACALLLGDGPDLRERRLALLSRRDAALSSEVRRLAPAVAGVPPADRMAILGLALPALDALSPAQSEALEADLSELSAGGAASPFDLAIRRAVLRRLARDPGAPPRPRLHLVDDAGPESLEVLSAIAWSGDRDPAAAQAALDVGVRALGVSAPWRLLARDRTARDRLDAALAALDRASPALKARLLEAAVAAALADARVTVEEAELVRAVSAALGLPIPPVVARPEVPAAG